MSSSAEDDETSGGAGADGTDYSNKRRVQRACDLCRRKKVRCDGGQMPDNRCSNCIASNYGCTYVEAAKKRGPPKAYVEALENRIENLQRLIERLQSDDDKGIAWSDNEQGFSRETPTSAPLIGSSSLSLSPTSSRRPSMTTAMGTSATPQGIDRNGNNSDDDVAQEMLADKLCDADLSPNSRFFGKSSGMRMMRTAISLKKEVTGFGERPLCPVDRANKHSWDVVPPGGERPNYIFPDDDLITALVHTYFLTVNVFVPLLHRPTFERSIAEGLHLKDATFGAMLLVVCSIASRSSNDPRVWLEGSDSAHSSGWKWFRQVPICHRFFPALPSLHDLQLHCLSIMFLQQSSVPQACWTLVAAGIRLAQDVGAHRRRSHNRKHTVEDELWKRVFWVLLSIDRWMSGALGRPCAINDEDFDLELPIECDDEYWEPSDPDQAFKQPAGKPSIVAYFNNHLKLSQVLAFALRTIYAVNKSKILFGFAGPQWEQRIVAELDSALNNWIDSVPDHLRWDPNREDLIFFNQSAFLHGAYYHMQIMVHRLFIPSPKKPALLNFPSAAICANAARSCSHVIDAVRRRNETPRPQMLMPAMSAAMMLLMNIWSGKQAGVSINPKKEMEDVHICMEAMRALEGSYLPAGRVHDIVIDLVNLGELPLPEPSPSPVNKRQRDSDSPIDPGSGSRYFPSPTSAAESSSTRPIARMRRVASRDPFVHVRSPVQQPQHPSHHQQMTNNLQFITETFPLPVHSEELGRLPVHRHSSRRSSFVEPDTHTSNAGWYPSQPQPAMYMQDGYHMEDLLFDHSASPFVQLQPQHQHAIPALSKRSNSMRRLGVMDADPPPPSPMWTDVQGQYGLNGWGL